MGMGRRGESGDCLTSCMQMTWFYVVSQRTRAMVGQFVEVCRKRGPKVNAVKSKVECGVCIDVSKFKYLGCVLDESGTDEVECRRKVASGRRVAGAIRSVVNARSLQLECAKVLHGSETMIWRETERSRITAVQMDNLRDFQGIRRMDKVPNA